MRRHRASFAAATAVLGSICILGLNAPEAAAAAQTTIVPAVEAWYQPDPSCGAPTGCSVGSLPASPPTPYPARTMHVGAQVRRETARTYLAFDLAQLNTDVSVTSMRLDIPLDVAAADGSSSPEQAKVLACTWSGHVAAADGAISAPPQANCSQAVKMSFVSSPQPHLQADIGPLRDALRAASGLVLLPDTRSSAATESWRVVFSAHDREGAVATAPAVIEYAVAQGSPATQTTPPPSMPTTASGPVGQGFVSRPGTPEGFAQPHLSAPAPPSPLLVDPPALQPASPAQAVTVGYAYPQVWLLPLLLILVVPLAARALLRDLTCNR
jgi:hypothetical protein